MSYISHGPTRPLVSVMLPTYNAGSYLALALRSVLEQDLGTLQMEIVVVDDASTVDCIDDILGQESARERVRIVRHPDNAGLAGNWNRCIQLARGEFIHILHQDDVVLPGFYERMVRGLSSNSEIGMAFCRHAFIDSDGNVNRISHRERWSAGLLSRWLMRISERQRIQCPAVLVRRSTYEALGGFDSSLKFALDWEMWVRIAASFDVWYDPKLLAHYRRHAKAETAKLRASDQTDADVLAAIQAISNYSPANRRAAVQHRAFRHLLKTQVKSASRMLAANRSDAAHRSLGNARETLGCLPGSVTKQYYIARIARLEARIAEKERD